MHRCVKYFYYRAHILFAFALICFLSSLLFSGSVASGRKEEASGKADAPQRTLILDGSVVHFAGKLQMNVTNFGFFGSLPTSTYAMSEAPSAQYPAGEGIEYLYASGLWVAAISDGVPSVSTAYPETEFYPSSDPRDVIYRSFEGAPNGARYPGDPDDDNDGRSDEDPLDGYDNDYDGEIDEDFAAIGKLMYSCQFTDFNPAAQQVCPEHTPLGIRVRQESYQWSEESFDDFIAVSYTLTNEQYRMLSEVYIGIYADLDAGPREFGSYFNDDLVGFWEGIRCAAKAGAEVPQRIRVVYVYDADGDGGRTTGYFGILFLGIRGLGPGYLGNMGGGLRAVRYFAGLMPYERGGEPINDFQRYECMSSSKREENPDTPKDYKVLLSAGPTYLYPGMPVKFDIVFVAGSSLDELLDNAAEASLVYNGIYIDKDKDPKTGIKGRESPVPGPIEIGIDPDACDGIEESVTAVKGETIWCNLDCSEERELWNADCYKGSMTLPQFQTGVDGKEAQLYWITSTAPPPPSLRAVAGDNCVTLHWDNVSEITPDAITRMYDFEGYLIYRAHDWHRPLGSTVLSGPNEELWYLIDSRDLVNGVPPDEDLRLPWTYGGFEYEPLGHIPEQDRKNYLTAFEQSLIYSPLGEIPCPPGLSEAECDTLEMLARWNLGYEGGRRFYRYFDADAKNGLPYFYAVVAYDHTIEAGKPKAANLVDSPIANFVYIVPQSAAQEAKNFEDDRIYVVPNPVTRENMAPWLLQPNNSDPSGEKCEFRNLPRCVSTVRIYTISGDLVQTLRHDGSSGHGTLAWDLISRNGQSITSGVYLFVVDPEDSAFPRSIGKFVVIR